MNRVPPATFVEINLAKTVVKGRGRRSVATHPDILVPDHDTYLVLRHGLPATTGFFINTDRGLALLEPDDAVNPLELVSHHEEWCLYRIVRQSQTA